MKRRCALAALSIPLLLAEPLAAQDPWSRVPPLPTSCYDNADPGFVGQLQAIRNEIVNAGEEQNTINSAIKQKLIDMDPSEKQTKFMAFLTKNPTEATKMMQAAAAAGQKQGELALQFQQRTKELDDLLKSAEESYARDLEPLAAIRKRWVTAMGDVGVPANMPLARQLATQYDAGYGALCTKYLNSESSLLAKYLSSYKSYLTTERMPGEQQQEQFEKNQFELYGVASTGFKPTYAHIAAADYVNAMITVFRRRETRTLMSDTGK